MEKSDQFMIKVWESVRCGIGVDGRPRHSADLRPEVELKDGKRPEFDQICNHSRACIFKVVKGVIRYCSYQKNATALKTTA